MLGELVDHENIVLEPMFDVLSQMVEFSWPIQTFLKKACREYSAFCKNLTVHLRMLKLGSKPMFSWSMNWLGHLF